MPVTEIGGVLVADDDTIRRASAVAAEAESHGVVDVTITTPDGGAIPLDPDLAELVVHILACLGNGPVSVTGLPEEVTTTTAAEMLGISRPTVMKRIAEGKIPAHKVGTHTRLRTLDVLHTRDQDESARAHAVEELRKIDEEFEAL